MSLLLAVACGLAAAEPVINSALVPLDVNKLLVAPQAGLEVGAPETLSDISLSGQRAETAPTNSSQAASGPDRPAAGREMLGAVAADKKTSNKPANGARANAERSVLSDRPGRQADSDSQGVTERSQPNELGLLGEVLKELQDSSKIRDLKNFEHEANAELNKFLGSFFFEIASSQESDHRRSGWQRSELKSSGSLGQGGSGLGNDSRFRQSGTGDQQLDSIASSAMLRKLMEEVIPWVVGAVLTFLVLRVGLNYWQVDGRRGASKRERASASRSVAGVRRSTRSSSRRRVV